MGNNYCAGKRDKVNKVKRYGTHIATVYKTEIKHKYEDLKNEAIEKYEDIKLEQRIKKSRSITSDGKLNNIAYKAGSTKFQAVLLKFEKEFPLMSIDINEFERRVKKLVFQDEYIYVWQLIECFKTCKGFEDIENEASLTITLLTSEYLMKDNEGSGQAEVESQTNDNSGGGQQHHLNSLNIQTKQPVDPEVFIQQKIYIPYLMLLATLFCKSTPRARATKFYQLVQMDLTPHVGCQDKELNYYFKKNLQLSSIFLTEIFKQTFIALALPEEKRVEIKEYSRDPLFTLKQEKLDSVNEKIFDDFLEEVFGTNTRPSKDEFIDKLSNEHAEFLVPSCLRARVLQKLFPKEEE